MTQQQPVYAGMRDDRGAALRIFGNIIQSPAHPYKTVSVAFTIRRAAAPGLRAKGVGISLTQLVKCKPIPGAAVQLDEVFQHVKRTLFAGDYFWGTDSIHTVCQMPETGVYHMPPRSSRCLP